MPTFKYRAKDGIANIEGVIEAQSREEAVDQIHQKGYIPVRVDEEASAGGAKLTTPLGASRKVKSKDITVFSRQLASLIKSGVPILRGLRITADQSNNPAFQRILNDIHANVKEGVSFSEAIAQYPKIFSPLYVAMIRSGESGGGLQEALVRLADHRLKQDEIFSRVRAALAYPILMTAVGFGTILFMLTFVMPRLMRIFTRIGQELPGPTRMLIDISTFMQKGWLWIILGLTVLIVVVRQSAKSKAQRLILSRLKLRLPLLGDFYQKSELARFSRTLELLIKSSIPILQAIKTAIPTLTNERIKEELEICHKELEQGGSFGKSLERSKLFPGFMTSLIMVGEESGRMDEALAEIASSYERDTDETMKVLTSLIEPLIILVMGLIVGLIVIAMLLPIFQMNMMGEG